MCASSSLGGSQLAQAQKQAQEVPSASSAEVRRRLKGKQQVESAATVESAPQPSPSSSTSSLDLVLVQILGLKELVGDEDWHETRQMLQDKRKANLAVGKDEYDGFYEALGFEVEEL